MYVYRVQKAIGSYYAAMTRTDAVVMTAGIGENSADLRERIFAGLAHMGMILDKERNDVTGQIGMNRIISIDDSPIKICVVTTDEEMRIARETDNLVSQIVSDEKCPTASNQMEPPHAKGCPARGDCDHAAFADLVGLHAAVLVEALDEHERDVDGTAGKEVDFIR